MELNIDLGPSRTGLTVSAVLYLSNAAVGSPIALTESGTVAGLYSAAMPSVGAGFYGVRFLAAGALVGTGQIVWDGTNEVTPATLQTLLTTPRIR